MLSSIKLRKSAGVPVSLAVHRLLTQGNRARDAGAPGRAAAAYGAALAADASLAHIWIQYGHMLRQVGDRTAADHAYHQALALKPGADPHLHLGHLHKENGNPSAAARSYLDAARLDPSSADALAELHALLITGGDITVDDIVKAIGDDRACALEDAHAPASIVPRGEAAAAVPSGEDPAIAAALPTPIVFDVSDLISYFQNARLPTGIQRVQIETVCNAIDAAEDATIGICAFQGHRDQWVEIPAAAFRELARLSMAHGDREADDWLRALMRLRLNMATAHAFVFPQGAFLVNLGTSWWLQNYFLYVRQAKVDRGIRYVPFVHDLIPVMAPEHCTRELTQDFISWAIGAFDHADFFLVNSEATRRDLLKLADHLDRVVDPAHVEIVTLDADFRKLGTKAPMPAAALAQWGIGRAPFVLFVSTIESRKNHLGAFDAWIALIRDHGVRHVPRLVCVGNRGWLNDAVYARLASHDELRNRVIMLSGLADAELDLLYRSCLFTLYPSNYEGWGLPVTESLCYGKVPLIADSSSLPEAGGAFADYFEAGSVPRLHAALDRLIFDTAYRHRREAGIAADFRPRSWGDIAAQIVGAIGRWYATSHEPAPARPPCAVLGAYHPIVRTLATRIEPGMRSAEVFRAGAGWWGPDNWGCWTKPGEAELHVALDDTAIGAVRLYVQLHGLPTSSCAWTIHVDATGERLTGELRTGAFAWTTIDIPALPVDRVIRLTIEGTATADLRTVTNGADTRLVSVGVAGFFLCAADDVTTRMTFLEAVALGNLPALAFDRRRTAGAPREATVQLVAKAC